MKWKKISNFDNYFISDCGKVRGKRGILKPYVGKNGYNYVGLYKDGKKKTALLHRLVAQAFLKNPDNRPEINHIDLNKSNNSVCNLQWVSRLENMNHAFSLGVMNDSIAILGKIAKQKRSISNKEAVEIRCLHVSGCPINGIASLARKYNLSRRAVRNIIQCKTYKDALI